MDFKKKINRKISVAPMMDCTDRHDRFFLRLMSKNVMLYTEMVATKSAIHGDRNKILSFSPEEIPLALQVGGSNKWVVFILITIFLLIAGFFLPPVAVLVMTSAILLPVITTLGFDPYWFAIVFTINMEIGLITPPVGLNLYIIKGITPDVSLSEILKGSIPFMIIMALAIVILCIFPEIVTWLPDKIMGKDLGF